MPIAVKSISDAAKYWQDGATNRAGRYLANAQTAGNTWQANTVAAAALYKAGVSQANIDKMFTGGVNKAGASSYNQGIISVGQTRFTDGVAKKQANYIKGETPMLSAIAAVDLGARAIRGSPSNYGRVQKVGDALHALRIAQKVGG